MLVITLISLIMLIAGAVNWFMVGAFEFNFFAWFFGGDDALALRILYAVIGVSAVWIVYVLVSNKGRLNVSMKK